MEFLDGYYGSVGINLVTYCLSICVRLAAKEAEAVITVTEGEQYFGYIVNYK